MSSPSSITISSGLDFLPPCFEGGETGEQEGDTCEDTARGCPALPPLLGGLPLFCFISGVTEIKQ